MTARLVRREVMRLLWSAIDRGDELAAAQLRIAAQRGVTACA